MQAKKSSQILPARNMQSKIFLSFSSVDERKKAPLLAGRDTGEANIHQKMERTSKWISSMNSKAIFALETGSLMKV